MSTPFVHERPTLVKAADEHIPHAHTRTYQGLAGLDRLATADLACLSGLLRLTELALASSDMSMDDEP